MINRSEADRIEQLSLQCLEAFPGTPEEFGALLYTATMPIANQDEAERYYSARKNIRELPGGAELLELEGRR